MSNETTRCYPRTMHEAFNCDCNPISGPYGKPSVFPFVVVAVAAILGVLLIWRIV
jgi:hypothetical protein